MTSRIYIHVPFCASKCEYCSFYSIPSPGPGDIDAYLDKMEKDFKRDSHHCGEIESIFIGGGTPTYLSAEHLGKLFSLINSFFHISADAEISIECNPETLTAEKAEIIADFSNRVSLGIQSFNPEFRRMLGRQGDPESIKKAIRLLVDNGIANIGCDLIYAIPGQSLDDWTEELNKAAALPLKHISAYSLTIEEGTLLSKRISNAECRNDSNTRHLTPESSLLKQTTEDRRQVTGLGNQTHNSSARQTATDHGQLTTDFSVEMWHLTGTLLKKHGFKRYEISNYSKRTFECRHNLEIWYGDKYLGFGPAASSFDGKKRWTNVSNLEKWMSGAKPEFDIISPEKRAREIFVMGLRTSQGWDKKYFLNRTGFSVDKLRKELDPLLNLRLLAESAENIKCTSKGLLLWNEVAERLI